MLKGQTFTLHRTILQAEVEKFKKKVLILHDRLYYLGTVECFLQKNRAEGNLDYSYEVSLKKLREPT